MSFIATDPKPAAEDVIKNDGFWPDVSPTDARAAMRLDTGTVTPGRLHHALITAMIEVGADVADWTDAQRAQGYETLSQVPSRTAIDGKPMVLHSYLQAVYSYAKASIIERMRDYDVTAAGQRKPEQLEEAPADLRRDALWAISRIKGRSRATVELI
ncbi:Phage head completion-stabilization protein [plant metagenome]|uniref:Phage head completion-stabilization protein n=1 Tax=plant metagenome TaxID=1297885 RepID=A0A484QR33_9ZZZZ